MRLSGSLMRAGQPLAPSAHIVIYAEPGTATMEFVRASPTDEMLRAPSGLLFYLLLEGDAWATDLGHYTYDTLAGQLVPTPSTEAVLGGIFGLPTTSTGFGLTQDLIAGRYEYVTRLNDSAVAIQLPSTPLYRLANPETVRVRLLPSTVQSKYSTAANDLMLAEALIAPSTSTDDAYFSGGTLFTRVSNSRRDHRSVDAINSASHTLIVTLDSAYTLVATPDVAALRAAFNSSQSELNGWNAIVQPNLTFTRSSASILTISLPALPEYDLRSPETITLTLPASVTSAGREITVMPPLRIDAALGSARVTLGDL